MAWSAKQLRASKGIMSNPNPRPGKTFNKNTVEQVRKFYERDEISCLMPGKKDCVTVRVDGGKEVLQKRLLLCNMAEAHRNLKMTILMRKWVKKSSCACN